MQKKTKRLRQIRLVEKVYLRFLTTTTIKAAILAMAAGFASFQAAVSQEPSQADPPAAEVAMVGKDADAVRFATFNVSFHRQAAGELADELEKASGRKLQVRRVAEIIQTVRPDVVLLNEFDDDKDGRGIKAFQKNYLAIGQHGREPIQYPHVFFAPVNTGVDSGKDLNGDGSLGTPNDALGFGSYPGQYAMVVLSKFAIKKHQVRTFQKFLWKDMPGNLMPTKYQSDEPFYSPAVADVFRLSSKSHWDVPIDVRGTTFHFLVAHPTPPVFDGPEDHNGRRNHDEIRMLADYVTAAKSDYLYDDLGQRGGLAETDKFVIAGDMNADPMDGDSRAQAAGQLTGHPLINHDHTPASEGGEYYSKKQGQKNDQHHGNPKFDTGDFRDHNVGNLRLDYCLPSKNLMIQNSGVFWPPPGQVGEKLVRASDHRMVWVDVK